MSNRPLNGILCVEDLQKTFYVWETFGRSYMYRRPVKVLLSLEDLWNVWLE